MKKILVIILITLSVNYSYAQEILKIEDLLPYLEESPQWKIAQAKYESVLSRYNVSSASFLPQINSQISYSLQEASYTLGKMESKNLNLNLSYSQVIFPWGQAGISLQSSAIDLEKEKNNLKLTYQNLIYQLTDKFYKLYLAQEQVKIAQESHNLYVKQRENAEKQYKSGNLSLVSLMDYQAKEKNTEINLQIAKNNLELAYKSLENFLGRRIERIPTIVDLNYKEMNEKPEDLLEILRNNNLSIKNASLDLEKAKLSLKQAQLPSLVFSLKGNYNKDNNSLSFSWDTQKYALSINYGYNYPFDGKTSQENWNLSFNFSIPLYDAGIRKEGIKQAELSLSQAEISFENTIKDVELSFWQTYYNLLQAQENVKQRELILEREKTNYEFQKTRFQIGLITEYDLKQYEISYLQAEYDLKKAILDFKIAKIQLENLLNRLGGF
ncbi:MAG: TolC family protein [Dictyoglomaceae bacterium]